MSWIVAVLVGVLVLVALVAVLVASIPTLRTRPGRRGPRGLPGLSIVGSRGHTGSTGAVGPTGSPSTVSTAVIVYSAADVVFPAGVTGGSSFVPLAFQTSNTGPYSYPPTGPSFVPLNGVGWTAVSPTVLTDMIITVADAGLSAVGSGTLDIEVWTSVGLGSWTMRPSVASVTITNVPTTAQVLTVQDIDLAAGDRVAVLLHPSVSASEIGMTVGGVSATMRLTVT